MNHYYYYYSEEQYEITERYWDGHRGHTEGTGRYNYHFCIYKKKRQGKDEFIATKKTKEEAVEFCNTANNKVSLKRREEALNKAYKKLNSICDKFIADVTRLSPRYKALREALEHYEKEKDKNYGLPIDRGFDDGRITHHNISQFINKLDYYWKKKEEDI